MIVDRNKFVELYQYNYNIQEEVFSIYKPYLASLGINFFAHTKVSYDLKVAGVVSDTDFAIFWCENDYLFPILNAPGFLLASDLKSLFPKEKEQQLLERFGIAHTLFYIKKNIDHADVFVLGGDPDNKFVLSSYINNAQYIEKFILHFAKTTTHLMDQAVNHSFQYQLEAFSDMRLNFQLAIKFPTLASKFSIPESFSETQKKLMALSQREMQCLMEAANAKTAKETAKELGLSYRTVEDYLDSVKTKLNCHSKKELIDLFQNTMTSS